MAPTIETSSSLHKNIHENNNNKNDDGNNNIGRKNDTNDDAYYESGDNNEKKKNNNNHINNNNNNNHHNNNNSNDKSITYYWIQFTNFLRMILTKLVVKLAVSAAMYPKTYLLCLTMISFLAIGIGYNTNFVIISDNNKMYAPINSRAEQHWNWITDENASGFTSNHPLLLYIHKDGNNILDTAPITSAITTTGEKNNNIHDTHNLVQVIRTAFDTIDLVKNVPGYEELCQLRSNDIDNTSNNDSNNNNEKNTCRILSITRLWKNNRKFFENEIKFYNALRLSQDNDSSDDYDWLIQKISSDTYPDGTPMFHETIIGKAVWDEEGNQNEKEQRRRTMISAKSILMIVELPLVSHYEDQLEKFENNVLDELDDMRNEWLLLNDNNNDNGEQQQRAKLEFFTDYAWQKEARKATEKDGPLMGLVVIVMISFACLLFYDPKDKVNSRCLIGLASVFTICMSIMCAFGIMFIIGVPYTQIAQLIPFVVFGVGLDDTFIITGEFYRRVNQEKCRNDADVIEKVRLTMEEIGISISLTTSTTVTAFFLGMLTSSMPGVIWVCYYAALTIVIDFLYQITYFIAIVVLNERRVRRNQRDCCCWITVLDEHEDNIDEEDLKSRKEENMDFQYSDDNNQNNDINQQQQQQQHLPILERFMSWYAKVLLNPFTKKMVLLFFSLLTITCLYSLSQFKQEFNFLKFTPDGSYLNDFVYAVEEYTDVKRTFQVYFRNINQSDPIIQEQMMHYIDDFTNNLTQLGGQPPALCWFRDLQLILGGPNNPNNNMTMNDEDRFAKYSALLPSSDDNNDDSSSSYVSLLDSMTTNQQLDLLLTNQQFRELYDSDIVIREQEIVSSRCTFVIRDLDLGEVVDQIKYMKDQRAITQSQPLNQLVEIDKHDIDEWSMFGFDSLYVFWEMFLVAVQEFIFTIVTGVVSVTSIAFLLIPHRTAILFVFPLITILYINFLGTIRFFDLQINGFTYLIVVNSVGLLVDYLMHILMRYYEIQQKQQQHSHSHHHQIVTTRDGCVTKVLETMGASILEGGLTTFSATLPLLLSTTAIFKQMFFAFFALVSMGIIHGLVLLPVILSIWGPIENHENNNKSATTTTNNISKIKNNDNMIVDNKNSEVDNDNDAINFREPEEIATQSIDQNQSAVSATQSKIQDNEIKDLKSESKESVKSETNDNLKSKSKESVDQNVEKETEQPKEPATVEVDLSVEVPMERVETFEVTNEAVCGSLDYCQYL